LYLIANAESASTSTSWNETPDTSDLTWSNIGASCLQGPHHEAENLSTFNINFILIFIGAIINTIYTKYN
jgi:hypothetical protein